MTHNPYHLVATELKAQGKTWAWLGRAINASDQTMSNWKHRGVPARSLPDIADALGIPVTALVTTSSGAASDHWQADAPETSSRVGAKARFLAELRDLLGNPAAAQWDCPITLGPAKARSQVDLVTNSAVVHFMLTDGAMGRQPLSASPLAYRLIVRLAALRARSSLDQDAKQYMLCAIVGPGGALDPPLSLYFEAECLGVRLINFEDAREAATNLSRLFRQS